MKGLAAIFFMLLVTQLQAQTDKLYLTNGSMLKGSITGINDSAITFVLVRDTLTINVHSINAMRLSKHTRGNIPLKEQLKLLPTFNQSKWGGQLALGGIADDGAGSAQFRTSVSAMGWYDAGQFLKLGIGSDALWYESFTTLPVYVYYGGSLSPFKRGLFYYLGYGRAIGWERSDCNCEGLKTGRYLKAGLGYQLLSTTIPVHFAIGWVQQKVDLEYDNPWNSSFWGGDYNLILRQSLNSIEMKIGVTF